MVRTGYLTAAMHQACLAVAKLIAEGHDGKAPGMAGVVSDYGRQMSKAAVRAAMVDLIDKEVRDLTKERFAVYEAHPDIAPKAKAGFTRPPQLWLVRRVPPTVRITPPVRAAKLDDAVYAIQRLPDPQLHLMLTRIRVDTG